MKLHNKYKDLTQKKARKIKMNDKCHGLTISSVKNGKPFYEEMEINANSIHKIENNILAETLITLGAVYGDDEWAIDISCEDNRSYIVIIEIGTGTTYTYLNPLFINLFEHSDALSTVFLCADMNEFEQDDANSNALIEVGINGNDCPALHVCDEKSDLLKIITYFLNVGTICPDVNWLKS